MLTDVQTDGRTSPIYRPELIEQSGQKLNTGVFARLSITATPKIKSQTINKLLLYKINKVSEIKIHLPCAVVISLKTPFLNNYPIL